MAGLQGMMTCLDQERRRARGPPAHGVALRLDPPHQLLQLLPPLQRPQACRNPTTRLAPLNMAEQVLGATVPKGSAVESATRMHKKLQFSHRKTRRVASQGLTLTQCKQQELPPHSAAKCLALKLCVRCRQLRTATRVVELGTGLRVCATGRRSAPWVFGEDTLMTRKSAWRPSFATPSE